YPKAQVCWLHRFWQALPKDERGKLPDKSSHARDHGTDPLRYAAYVRSTHCANQRCKANHPERTPYPPDGNLDLNQPPNPDGAGWSSRFHYRPWCVASSPKIQWYC